ncbi:MAG TPA: PIN domain nuclease [Gammaproteobacteria bacterium]|nr:PIN domain nuclease [Gammaproteobacteria bacterium]
MYLIDTSVWIDYFREEDNPAVNYFIKIIEEEIPFGITSFIYQEILQGAASKKDFQMLIEYLETQRFFHPKKPIHSYTDAAKLHFNCREKGMTIRSTIDCLIAQIAIEHNLILVHKDKDFLQIKKANAQLKLYNSELS